ncbi:MAG: LacI family transcriptional regulator [Anaerolineales bacterium]|nr:MAG: LacI family transcriptional regulator [Anaerolineales bacterium]
MHSSSEPRNRSRATIDDVASKADVSIATVSRVINHTGPVAIKTRERVIAAIAELNYRPQTAAQVLASRKTSTVGLFLSEISGEFFTHILRGIEAAARENGFGLLVYSNQNGLAHESTKPLPLGEHNTDGLVVFVDSLSDRELVRLNKVGFPVVLIHRSSPADIEIPCVTIENKLGTRKMIDHLIQEHGYRRLAFLAGKEEQEDSYWREIGYRESLASHNIPFDPELIGFGGFNREQAESVVNKWLSDGLEFDAVFSGDDEAAIGVLTALKLAGKRVPEDVAVVGFDDTYLAQYLTPPLTTVRAPIEQVGREAIRLLVRLIQGDKTEPIVLLPTELMIRQSCGCV